jgi:hypothetical protein
LESFYDNFTVYAFILFDDIYKISLLYFHFNI